MNVIDKAERFDFNNKVIYCESNKKYNYDFLVLATGCVPSPHRIEGLKEAGNHFYQYEAARTLDKLAKIEKVVYLFYGLVFLKHLMYLIMWYCSYGDNIDAGRTSSADEWEVILRLFIPIQQLLNFKKLSVYNKRFVVLPAVFSERDIKAKRGFTLSHADPDKKIAYSKEGEAEPVWYPDEHPPITAAEAIRNTGLWT